MGKYNNPVPIKCWEDFLIYHKCKFVRQKGSHHHWKHPGSKRTITFHGHKKEVPRFHIQTCLKTMKITNSTFNTWAEANC